MWKMDMDSIDFVSIYSQINYGMITLETGFLWLIGGVYAKCSTIGRKELWAKSEELLGLNLPTLIAGDFNSIADDEEKLGGAAFKDDQEVREFHRFITRISLVDLQSTGPCVTWCNNQDPPRRVLKRLDRALANDAWLLAYLEAW